MTRLIPIGRRFFAVALVAFGVMQFVVGDFVAGRAPAWPAALPGRLVWADGSGVVLILSGAAIFAGKRAWAAGIASATMIFVWAVLRHIPEIAADTQIGLAWTNAGKALMLFGGALAAGASVRGDVDADASRAKESALYVGRYCLGAFMVLAGIQHFLFTDIVAHLVPAWIPGHVFWTYFAAVALIAGGVGLALPPTARLAAALSGLMVFLWLLMLHIPRALAAPDAGRRNEWTAVFEALAVTGIALVVIGPPRARRREEVHAEASPQSTLTGQIG
jgi:uncharacterized membrane protein